MPRSIRQPSFWVAVAITGFLGNLVMELVAEKVPSAGLRSLVAFAHRGNA